MITYKMQINKTDFYRFGLSSFTNSLYHICKYIYIYIYIKYTHTYSNCAHPTLDTITPVSIHLYKYDTWYWRL